MNGNRLTQDKLETIRPGEAVTLASVLTVLAIGIVAVVCYKIFSSASGSAKIPTGWHFTWK